MNHLQWEFFDSKGGAEWLREFIDDHRLALAAKVARNRKIREDVAQGMTQRQVAEKHRVSRYTVWRAINEQ